jgi:hypothetical protein
MISWDFMAGDCTSNGINSALWPKTSRQDRQDAKDAKRKSEGFFSWRSWRLGGLGVFFLE